VRENGLSDRLTQWYKTFRFFFACVIIFAGGYFFAKPRNYADKSFAPCIAAIGVLSLWHARKSNLEPLRDSDLRRKSKLSLVLEWGLIILVAVVMWAYVRFGAR
jgi:hypothetical protein